MSLHSSLSLSVACLRRCSCVQVLPTFDANHFCTTVNYIVCVRPSPVLASSEHGRPMRQDELACPKSLPNLDGKLCHAKFHVVRCEL